MELLKAAFLALAVTVTAAARPASRPAAWTTLRIDGRANATPTIATRGQLVAVAWGASLETGGTDVYVALSRDEGRTFGAPVRVNDVAGDARVNGEQPPHVDIASAPSGTPAPSPRIVVVWTTKGSAGTRLVQSESRDEARTFSRATEVPGTGAAGNRGWEAIATGPDGRTLSVWLDHRELADDTMAARHHDHGAKPDGVAMAQRSKLYLGSLDGAVAPHAVTGGVCYCCKTALVADRDGSVYAAWRHVYPGNLRDIAFASSRDGGRSFSGPTRVSEDGWVLEGCPDDGPAMTVDGDRRIHLVWPTLVEGSGDPNVALFYSSSSDSRRFTPRLRLPTDGTPHHPTIASADGHVFFAWDELVDRRRRVVLASLDGRTPAVTRESRVILGDAEPAVYPVVVANGRAAIVAWTSGTGASSSIRVQRVSTSPVGSR